MFSIESHAKQRKSLIQIDYLSEERAFAQIPIKNHSHLRWQHAKALRKSLQHGPGRQ